MTRRLDWTTLLTWLALTIFSVTIFTVLAVGAGWAILRFVDWFAAAAWPTVTAWLDGRPGTGDIAVLGLLTLAALAAAERWRDR